MVVNMIAFATKLFQFSQNIMISFKEIMIKIIIWDLTPVPYNQTLLPLQMF